MFQKTGLNKFLKFKNLLFNEIQKFQLCISHFHISELDNKQTNIKQKNIKNNYHK